MSVTRDLTATLPSDNATTGFFDYNDLATSSVPISVPATLTFINLTNDGLGAFTNKLFKPSGVTDVWDSVAGVFNFSELSLGDTIGIRLDLSVTTLSPNQTVSVVLELGIGGTSYQIPFIENTFKTAGVHNINRYNLIYMGDVNTLNNTGQFKIKSDALANCIVNGWLCNITRRG